MVSGIGNLCADRMNELIQKIEVTSILSFARKMMLRTRIPFLCKVCTFSGSYDKPGGRKGKTNALHSIAHMAIGGDMADVLTSPNDPAVFFGYHGNIGTFSVLRVNLGFSLLFLTNHNVLCVSTPRPKQHGLDDQFSRVRG